MRILILNRRDILNPSGGGAEVYTHEIARGLVAKYGCEVEVFSSGFPGCARQEAVDGVTYIRRGNEATVHLRGFYYALKHKARFDRIIDEFNGVGFFTFAFPNAMLLIYQLYKEFWVRELGVLGWFPYMVEPLILSLYRRKRVITISSSTKRDLEHLGFRRITIVMVGLERAPLPDRGEKDKKATLVFLGRLKSTKRPEDALKIYEMVKRELPGCRLWVIGRGPQDSRLKAMAKDLGGVTFYGWVSEEKKYELLRRSHILLVPGLREGFGINIIEAAAAGTPAVGYSVHGVEDAIRDGVTGYLVNSVSDAATGVIQLLSHRERYDIMSGNCLRYAAEFSWNARVDEFWAAIRDLPGK
jgi:glycosyltransferase involved in cell wall biosynthesis